MLAALGYRADLAANGLEVIQALDRQVYDVILMDVQMPEMDGLEATRHIVARQPNPMKRPWIIALTANAVQGDRDICLEAGMDDYISKPIKKEELATLNLGTDIMTAQSPTVIKAGGPVVFTDRSGSTIR